MSQDIRRQPALPCFVLMFSNHAFSFSMFFVVGFFHYFDQSVAEPPKLCKMKNLNGPFFYLKTGIWRRRRRQQEYEHHRLGSTEENVTWFLETVSGFLRHCAVCASVNVRIRYRCVTNYSLSRSQSAMGRSHTSQFLFSHCSHPSLILPQVTWLARPFALHYGAFICSLLLLLLG